MFIAKQLLEKPPSRDRDPTKSASTPSASSRHFTPKQFGVHSQFGSYPNEPVAAGPPVEHMAFKMLCTNDQVGGVIGKAGYIVKNIKNETDSDIMISELVSEADSEDRLITVNGPVVIYWIPLLLELFGLSCCYQDKQHTIILLSLALSLVLCSADALS